MNQITPHNIQLFNDNLRDESPEEIIAFALDISDRPLITTSFGAYSAAILFACTRLNPKLQVIWCDTGYNTPATYKHVHELSEKLELNLEIFTPKLTTAFLDSALGRPNVNDPEHKEFSEKVKLEPFKRAFEKHQPDLWFTNLRKSQNEHRKLGDILSFSKNGILKVSPFFYYSDAQLEQYLEEHELPLQFDYFDPVKAYENRECGIHLKN
jgi:phosphoadenosine phosphosulfate reductase